MAQVDPIKPTLKPPGSNLLTPKYEEPLSSFAVKFNLRRYTEADTAKVDHTAATVATAHIESATAVKDAQDGSTAAARALGGAAAAGLEAQRAALTAGAYTRPLFSST